MLRANRTWHNTSVALVYERGTPADTIVKKEKLNLLLLISETCSNTTGIFLGCSANRLKLYLPLTPSSSLCTIQVFINDVPAISIGSENILIDKHPAIGSKRRSLSVIVYHICRLHMSNDIHSKLRLNTTFHGMLKLSSCLFTMFKQNVGALSVIFA